MSEPIDPPDERPHRSLRTGLIVAVVVAALVGAGWFLLTSFEAEPPSRSELVAAYESSGMPPAQAECAADAILDNLSDHEVSMIVERGPSGAPVDDPDVADEPIDLARTALGECRALEPVTTEPDPVTSEPEGTATTTTPVETSPTTDGGSFDTIPSTSTTALNSPEATTTTTTTTVAG